MSQNNFIIRCRGIILHKDKLLLVKHNTKDNYYALPGGHLEFGEDIKNCMIREIEEELGVKPILGNLLYIHNYKEGCDGEDKIYSVEFFFEIKNGKDYIDCENLKRSHAEELAEIKWADKSEDINILPKVIGENFKKGKLISEIVRFTEVK